ncbi:MAG: hypothetical protein GC159_13465 [Phycisphaera sp.]|nr:hypothetical protein [Phycisphaera sp.]
MRRFVHTLAVVAVVTVAATLAACQSAPSSSSPSGGARSASSRTPQRSGPPDPATRYFDSPKAAVEQIADMLDRADYATLSAYYDLSGTGIDRATLRSGAFFVDPAAASAPPPANLWRFKQPFSPGFGYAGHRATRTPGVYIVDVSIRIDQGEGQTPRIGYDEFRVRKTDRGWTLLPDEPEAAAK